MFPLEPASVLTHLSALCVESARVAYIDNAQVPMPPSEPAALLEAYASALKHVSSIHGSTDVHLFYMYRAQSEAEYEVASGLNLASAEGVLWSLHNKVVHTCNRGVRHYEITRIKRYKVTLRSTRELCHSQKFRLVPAVLIKPSAPMDPTSPLFHTYGYMPGCIISSPRVANYWPAVWYSLPGHCLFRDRQVHKGRTSRILRTSRRKSHVHIPSGTRRRSVLAGVDRCRRPSAGWARERVLVGQGGPRRVQQEGP